MIINPQWRVLTIGDGDLSFSRSLYDSHGISNLTATIFDPVSEMVGKYGRSHLDTLKHAGIKVHDKVDVCDPSSWQGIPKHMYDLVIFQFPLRAAFKSAEDFSKRLGSENLLNRLLLRRFLQHSVDYFLSPQGPGLSYVTSKDVKPYNHWNIEGALHIGLPLAFRGFWEFDASDYPEYQVRNVERDKFVRDTAGKTYVWSRNGSHVDLPGLLIPDKLKPAHCSLCGKGPFMTEQDRQKHQASRRHSLMADYETQWIDFLHNIGELADG